MTDNPKGYARPELLVTPQALSAALAGSAPPLLLDLRPAEQYASGHLPGAVHLDLWGISLIDTDPAPLKAFLWVIEHLLAERGVSADRPVVVYEETSGTRAARAFWFLELFGHPDVRLLDGGVKAWTAAGLPLSLHHVAPVPTTWLGTLPVGRAGHLEGRARSPRARRRIHPRHEIGRRVLRHARPCGARGRDSRSRASRMEAEPGS